MVAVHQQFYWLVIATLSTLEITMKSRLSILIEDVLIVLITIAAFVYWLSV